MMDKMNASIQLLMEEEMEYNDGIKFNLNDVIIPDLPF